MKTIGAKELRLNLNEVLDEVLAGEEIIVKHRFKAPVHLTAKSRPDQANGAALARTLEQLRPQIESHKSRLNPHKSLKQLYRESLAKKYGTGQ